MIIKSVGTMSLGKMLCSIYASLGLIFGTILSLVSLFTGGGPAGVAGPERWLFSAAVILLPLVYGLFGFITGLVVGTIYNFMAKHVGGLELELD